MAGIGIPIKVMHEAEGHTITVELKTGEVYRGQLVQTEDNMNCQLKTVTRTGRDGRVTALEQVFLRGSQVRFMILPDMLKNAPMFVKADSKVGKGLGRGRSTLLRAKAEKTSRQRGAFGGRGGPGGDRGRGRGGRS